MSERDELLELLKPVIAMREACFPTELMPGNRLEACAEKINLLLGSTLAAYKFVIDKQEPESILPRILQNLSGALTGQKSLILSNEIDFYGDFHCWKMNELIYELISESSRAAFPIRQSLLREMMLKQLEFCHLMINFSHPGDIWHRSFGAAIDLMKSLYKDEDITFALTQNAEYECLHDSAVLEFSYPRFQYSKQEHEHLLQLFGLGIEIFLLSEGEVPEKSETGKLRALLDDESGKIVTVTYETSCGVFFREKGFWWEFTEDVSEFFEDFSIIFVKEEFINYFDEASSESINEENILPFAIPAEELFPND